MDNDILLKIHKSLTESIEKINANLSIIAFLQLADEFYTKEDRANLYVEYEKLYGKEKIAFDNFILLNKELGKKWGELGYDAMVKKIGIDKVTEDRSELDNAHKILLEARSELGYFEQKHKLIIEIWDFKNNPRNERNNRNG